MTARERILRILVKLLAHPYRFTRRDLADEFNDGGIDAINGDVEELKKADIGFHQEKKHPYTLAIIPDRRLKELKHLMPLNEEDRTKIRSLLNQYSNSKDALYLNNKLDSLYDFQKLGLRALQRPALEKIDLLETAKLKEKQVIIERYHSNNSNSIQDRRVEPFHINPELDTLQAFDADKKKVSHFRLSRIERVVLTSEPWHFKGDHNYKYTDVFRIADNDQVLVQLRLNVWGYNALVEAFPKARGEIVVGAQANTFEFQSMINRPFLGLINFIMGNAEHVEVLHPDTLKAKIQEEAKKILEKNSP
ncbi:MAG: hypothetical protein DHS20C18_54460 [Saprospiraceae bacterium]|nr:MAG: hypothetical protein DHS20C18_54460 [Saprospiraceae bacterium]